MKHMSLSSAPSYDMPGGTCRRVYRCFAQRIHNSTPPDTYLPLPRAAPKSSPGSQRTAQSRYLLHQVDCPRHPVLYSYEKNSVD